MDFWTVIYGTLYTLFIVSLIYWGFKAIVLIKEQRVFWKRVQVFPFEEKFHPLLGSLHLFPGPGENGLAFMRSKVVQFPRIHGVWAGPILPNLVLHCPEVIKTILKTTEPKSSGFSGVYRLGLKWLGEGLLISNGEKWARNRRLLTPAFHFDILQPYVNIYNDRVNVLQSKIQKVAEQGESFEVFSFVTLCTLDIILRCAFSYDNDIQLRGENHPYAEAVSELNDLWVERSLKPYLYPDFLYGLTRQGRLFQKHCDFVHSVTEEIIQRRRHVLATGEEDRGSEKSRKYFDFLDILLKARDEDGMGLSEQDIRNEADTFLFEGHDTTTSSISWALYSLATHPEHQHKVHRELDELFQGRDSEHVEWEDLQKLPYLTMCIKESMRLHSPVPFIQRTASQDLELDGKIVPKGTLLSVQIYNLHHNPVVWEEPMEYRPLRFHPDNITKMDSHAFLPFSAGPRNCIGQNFAMHEQKVLLARVLYRYRLELDPSHKVEKKLGLVMKSKNGIKMFARPRTSTCM